VTITNSEKNIKRWINRIGVDELKLLLELKKADTLAHAPEHCPKEKELQLCYQKLLNCSEILDNMNLEEQCVKLSDLKINGKDLMNMGIKQGPEIGEILNHLLDEVLDEKIENDKDVLTQEVNDYLNEKNQILTNDLENQEEILEKREEETSL
jgi:tRNA nucleotidyltransferase (CCA-adding enzyme)